MDKKIKHLELVQNIINRMASNSFLLKGWAVTLVAGIFALADKLYYLVAFIPVIVFWGLDAYYLLQERLYRALYDKVRNTAEENIDFSLSATTREFKSDKNNYVNCLKSKTVLPFYLPLAIVCAGITFIALCKH